MPVVEKNSKTGLKSLEMFYEPVENTEFGSTVAYKSRLRINDSDMGVLLPNAYNAIADRSTRSEKLFNFSLKTVLEDLKRIIEHEYYCEWISVYLPLRLLFKENFAESVCATIKNAGIEAKQICFEVPETVLGEDIESTNKALGSLTSLGFHTLLSSFAGDYSPIMRLSGYQFDFIGLDATVAYNMQNPTEAPYNYAVSVFELVEASGAEAIADGVTDAVMKKALPENCIYVTGKDAGNQKKISGIRS